MLRKLCLIILLLLSGCSNSANEDQDQIHIALSVYNLNDMFISEITQHIKQFAREEEGRSGIKIVVDVYDAQSLQNKQINQMDDFKKRNYDVICMNLVDRTAASTIIDKAEKAEIPIIFFNREPVRSDIELWDRVYYVGSQSAETGYLEGRLILDVYQKNRKLIDKNHDQVIQYVLLEGEQGHQDTLIRSETCLYPFTEKNIALEFLDSATANWRKSEGKEQMNNFLEAYGDAIEVVFSNNDEMALGAIEAIESTNYSIQVVGVDGTIAALKAIQQDKLLGTVLNDSEQQAKDIFDLSFRLSRNESTEDLVSSSDRRIYTPSLQITKENVEEIMQRKHNGKDQN